VGVEAVPQSLQELGVGEVTAPGEQVDHLAVDPQPAATLRQRAHELAHRRVEARRIHPLVVEERVEGLARVTGRQPPRRHRRVDGHPQALETLPDRGPVHGGGDDQQRVAGEPAVQKERGHRIGKRFLAIEQLDRVRTVRAWRDREPIGIHGTRITRPRGRRITGLGGIRLATSVGMIQGPSPIRTRLADHIQQLAAFAPTAFPVLSLYLDLVPNRHEPERDVAFVRAALAERLANLHPQAPERASLERDVVRIETHLREQLSPTASGLAVFACSGDGFFDAVQLDTPLARRAVYVGSVPHLYPLVRLEDEYPRYAAVMLEAHHARIYVFGLDTAPRDAAIAGPPHHPAIGGWSQARFHRRAENLHLQQLDDVVVTLDRIVSDEDLRRIVVTGHDAAVPRLRSQLPARLSEKLVDVLQVDRTSGEGRLLHATLEALRLQDAETGAGHAMLMRGSARPGVPIGYAL
jgi:hypothetical protein